MRNSKSLVSLLTITILFPIIVASTSEIFKTTLIWHFRIVDFLDFFITAPIYFASFLLIFLYLENNGASLRLKLIYIVFCMFFLYGHSMHIAANSISTYSFEIHNYREKIPYDMYELIYFLDETLSHIITFLGLYGFLLCLLCFDSSARSLDTTNKINYKILFLGIFYGVGQGIAFIESSKVWLSVILITISIFILILICLQRKIQINKLFEISPISIIFIGMLPSQVFTYLIYWLIFGSLIQPSLLGF